MRRDSRIGPEHWSGCHNFSNIVCDGRVDGERKLRQGGLKMGGTYWYYYKLDDDLEFHNAAEPSTTQCPMLPGQLVNVLSVPFNLSGNRSRNGSVSSTNSDLHTMNPDDKYVNPRPVPRPQLPRLRTSPTLPQESWPVFTPSSVSPRTGRSATSAGTGSASTLRFRSKSPGSALSGSIRSAFRSFRTPRSRSPEGRSPRSITRSPTKRGFITPTSQRSVKSSREASPHVKPENDLVLRHITTSEHITGTVDLSSFQQHRRQRSRSRDPSSLRNSLVIDTISPILFSDFETQRAHVLSAVKEVLSTQNTPANLPASSSVASSLSTDLGDREKRLPTLPNSPSSVYPPSMALSQSIDIHVLESHFSSTTIDISESEDEARTPDTMNFSVGTGRLDLSSFCHDSIIFDEPMSACLRSDIVAPQRSPGAAYLEVDTEFEDTPQRSVGQRQPLGLVTALSSSTMSSMSTASVPPSPARVREKTRYIDSPWEFKGSDTSARFRYDHYRLPSADFGSETTLKMPSAKREGFHDLPRALAMKPEGPRSPADPMIAPSTSMQQLIDELSYLGDMIHQT